MIEVIRFDEKYRDDTIFCLLLSKDVIGQIPRLNEDLLNIQKNYFDNNDMFWIALDKNKRVVGMVGTKTVSPTDMWLKRLYVKPMFKKMGIGSALLATVERYAVEKGVNNVHTRFIDDYIEASHFYTDKGFVEVEQSDGLRHFIKNII